MIDEGFRYTCDVFGCQREAFTRSSAGPEGWAEFRETGWSRPANVCPLHARAMHHQDSAANYLAPALLIEPYGEGVSSE